MRFNVIWLADDGYAEYAEHFEHPSIEEASRFISRKLNRKYSVRPGIWGYMVIYADSEFIRRHTYAPGYEKRRQTALISTEEACREYPHLLRPQIEVPELPLSQRPYIPEY